MALLARRRSGQTLTPRLDDIGKGRLGLPALPDDYDPRIRGKLFHDFSAPRPRPNVPMMQQQSGNSQSANAQDVQNNNNNNSNDNDNPSPTPPPKESLGSERGGSPVVSDRGHPEPSSSNPTPSSVRPHSSVELYDTPLPLCETNTNKQPEKRASTSSNVRSSSTKSKASIFHDGSFQPSGLPRHLTSNASRFSFDMASGDSASQERIMEEKHKQKEAAKRAKAQLDRSNDSDSEDFDYDAMMDDDGLEEKIPGINADADVGDEFDEFMSRGHVLGLPGNQLFVPVLPTVMSNPMSPLDLNSSAPRSPEKDMPTPLMVSPNPASAGLAAGLGDMPFSNIPLPNNTAFLQTAVGAGAVPSESSLQHEPPPLFNQGMEEKSSFSDSDEDDMYFDDGMIDDILGDINGEGEKFDESVFDDETSHLYERKPKFRTQLPILPTQPGGDGTTVDDAQQAEEHCVNDNDEDGKIPLVAQNSLLQRNNISGQNEGIHGVAGGMSAQKMIPSTIRGLTEGNLEKYHSALAKAANDAALKGRFERSGSVSEQSSGAGSAPLSPDSHPGLTADDSRVSQNVDSMAFEEAFDDFDYNDDYLDDDPIIAAANAEALENDDEGFYGQEFGFYPQAVGNNCDDQMVLGGYFGTRGVEGITRSHSGRVNFQEPSLTPITERSEWSTRNSIISLTTHAVVAAGGASASLTNPSPLPHLGDMGSIDDQMNALMKLRRGAWGGSNGSLRSSAASQGQPGSSPTVAAASSRGSFASFHDILPEQGRCGSSGNSNSTILAGSPVGVEGNGYSNVNNNNNNNASQQHSSYSHNTHSLPHRNHPQQQNHYQVDNDTSSPLSGTTTTIYNYMNMPPTEKDKPLSLPKHSEQRQLPPQHPHSHHHLHHHLHHHHHHHHHSHPPLNIDTDKANIAAATAVSAASPYSKEDNINSSISHHSRANSTTESISYVKETDETGGDRWVLERRRTSESGEREVVETEILSGGII
ncbi:hypothetical protein ACJ72_00887 [Emergomyces africanus]|uniref:AGC-kinase C-terminal domain-containing protein n=1 Tax=Emergomyces africanus TaxID=1955775 RepID=A0A1B7P6Y7_9EURO|nr:hypothetical protein ACJ72_00887 [Emergomyces africanus]